MRKMTVQNLQGHYDRGRQYAEKIEKLTADGMCRTSAVGTVAPLVRCSQRKIKDAVVFMAAVDHIVDAAGEEARSLLFSRGNHLTAKVVLQVARTHPDRIRYAIEQVRAGRSPFAPPPAGTVPPFDTLHYGEVCSRSQRASGLLDFVTGTKQGLASLDALRTGAYLASIRHSLRIVSTHVRCATGLCEMEESLDHGKPARESAASNEDRWVAAAAGLSRKNARDIARLVDECPPTPEEAGAVQAAVIRVHDAVTRLSSALRDFEHGKSDPLTSSGGARGTYIVMFHLLSALNGHVVGRLGTFDLPAGYYLYVGSAFGAGGVSARVGRHQNPRTVKKWNIDYLKDRSTFVEVWWTNDSVKRECQWSAILAGWQDLSCPALGFGSNDCKTCPAHLYRADKKPSFRRFAANVKRIVGHAPVYKATSLSRIAKCEPKR